MKKGRWFSGFSLIEAMVAVAVFGAMFVVLSNIIISFQRSWIRDFSKQNISAQFVRVFRVLDTDIGDSRYNYIYSYSRQNFLDGAEYLGKKPYVEQRWFFFPISANKIEKGYPVWDKLILYSLVRPEGDKCQNYDSCPHKNLVKRVMKFEVTSMTYDGHSVHEKLRTYRNKIPELLKAKIGHPELISYSVVENDITDLTIDLNSENLAKFELTLLRINDAERASIRGNTNLLAPDRLVRKYIEKTNWFSMIENI